MNKTVQRIVVFLLVALTAFGMFPAALATDIGPEDTIIDTTLLAESAGEDISAEEPVPTEETSPVEENQPKEETQPKEEPAETTMPTEEALPTSNMEEEVTASRIEGHSLYTGNDLAH